MYHLFKYLWNLNFARVESSLFCLWLSIINVNYFPKSKLTNFAFVLTTRYLSVKLELKWILKHDVWGDIKFKTRRIIYSNFRIRVTERVECKVVDKNDVAGNGDGWHVSKRMWHVLTNKVSVIFWKLSYLGSLFWHTFVLSAKGIATLLLIQEVSGSDLGPKTDWCNWGFPCFFSVPPGKLDYGFYFQQLPLSVGFTNYSVSYDDVWRYWELL
jgi:hypothetical protein